MDAIRSKLRKLRIIQMILLGLVLISGVFVLSSRSGTEWSAQHSLMAALAFLCLFEGFYVRRRFVARSGALLAADWTNSQALRQWESWQMVCLAMAGAIAMYGFVIRIVLRGTLKEAVPFYLLGIVLLFLWSPTMPVPSA